MPASSHRRYSMALGPKYLGLDVLLCLPVGAALAAAWPSWSGGRSLRLEGTTWRSRHSLRACW